MSKETYLVLRGKLHWAKIVGDAQPHTGNPKYDKGPSWSVDLTPDAKSRALLEEHGLMKKLREPGNGPKEGRTESFITLRHLLNRPDGTQNRPLTIKDVRGEAWDGSKIGNESVADVKVKAVDYGSGSEMGLYIQAVRILDHIPYERNDFEPLSEDDEFFGASEDEVGAGEDGPTAAPESPPFDPDNLDDIPE